VSFNIGRVRRAGEPLNTAFAWAEQNLYIADNFVKKEVSRRSQCPEDSGCKNVKTTQRVAPPPSEVDTWLLQSNDEEDMDWAPKSEEDDEPLEWEESDDASDIADSVVEEGEEFQLPGDIHAKSRENLIQAGTTNLSIATTILDSSESSESDNDDDNDENFGRRYERSRNLEHLAGPGCSISGGYNGTNITAEEMFGSCTAQCLVRKDDFWLAEPDDELFELSSNYFLSGLGGHMNSRDSGGLEAYPLRHGLAEEFNPDDDYWEPGFEVPMPFHPACLEIYKRVAHLRFGFFNVNGLCQWRFLKDSEPPYQHISHSDPAVRRGLDQLWNHHTGDEWLAANPLFIPALPRLLQSAVYGNAASFDKNDSAFPIHRAGTQFTGLRDCFYVLPQELLFLIIDKLRSPDIASLRLASRTFTHLPIVLWKKLLRQEMPWFWEVWDNSQPYKWTRFSASDLETERKRIHELADEFRLLQSTRRMVIQEEMPELWEQYCTEHPWITEDINAEESIALQQSSLRLASSKVMFSLPQDRTNWYEVYRLITKHWDELKGLRNRRRIWSTCNTICDRIKVIEGNQMIE
jgi:hypothetical protein